MLIRLLLLLLIDVDSSPPPPPYRCRDIDVDSSPPPPPYRYRFVSVSIRACGGRTDEGTAFENRIASISRQSCVCPRRPAVSRVAASSFNRISVIHPRSLNASERNALSESRPALSHPIRFSRICAARVHGRSGLCIFPPLSLPLSIYFSLSVFPPTPLSLIRAVPRQRPSNGPGALTAAQSAARAS